MTRMDVRARRIAIIAIAAALLIVGAPDPATAQRGQPAAQTRPGWLPRVVDLGDSFTAAQKATAIARLEQIERLLLQVPELARPQGFEVMPQFYGGRRKLGPGGTAQPDNVLQYMLRLWFFHPTRAIAGQGCTCLTITVNDVAVLGSADFRDELGREVWVERQRGDQKVPHATQVYDGLSPDPADLSTLYVLFTRAGELPWRNLTREEFYRASIFAIEGKDGARLAEYRKSLEKTPYQEWIDGAAQRRKDREETLAMMAAMQPAQEVARMRKTLEDTEREVTERLKASEATDRVANRDALAASRVMTDAILAELEAMSPAERRLPALVDMSLTEGPAATGWRLTNVDSPKAWRILTPDYDFFRARTSVVEARNIMVNISARGTGAVPVVHNALWQTFQQLDWTALHGLVNVPR